MEMRRTFFTNARLFVPGNTSLPRTIGFRGFMVLWLVAATAACGGDNGLDEPVVPDDVPAVTLSLTPEQLTFKPGGGTSNAIRVKTAATWRAQASDSELRFSPASGQGDGAIVILDIPADRTHTLTVIAGEGTDAVTRKVTVTRPAETPDLPGIDPKQTVFSLDFGASMGNDSKFADSFSDWQTQTGTGAGEVAYESFGVKIRSGYDGASVGASGKGYATMTATRTSNHFTIRKIALPTGITDFTLSFFTTCATGDLKLTIGNAAAIVALDHKASATYNTWARVEVGFSLKTPVEKIDLAFAPSKDFNYDDRRYGLNFDDIVLTTGGGGQEVDLAGAAAPARLPELPDNWVAQNDDKAVLSGDYAFCTHWTTTVTSGKRVRNYSYCYDTRRHNPIWVAYPLAACYLEGGYSRTTPDPWAPDPSLDAGYQSKIYRSDGAAGNDPYQYWSVLTLRTLGRSGTWSKGHLCMSSERGGAGKEINIQTFYPTNIAPQPTAAACDFGRVWGDIEALISGTRDTNDDISANDGTTNLNRRVDTLYIVAGCYYEHDRWQDYDSSDFNQPTEDPKRKICIMPTHQWKAALRVKDPATHKAVAACSANELQAVGFWIETFIDSGSVSRKEQLRAIAVPVSYIEEKMGFRLFPDVPEAVKTAYNPEDWGF